MRVPGGGEHCWGRKTRIAHSKVLSLLFEPQYCYDFCFPLLSINIFIFNKHLFNTLLSFFNSKKTQVAFPSSWLLFKTHPNGMNMTGSDKECNLC